MFFGGCKWKFWVHFLKYNPANARWESNISHALHVAAEPDNLTAVPLFTICPPLSSDLIYLPAEKTLPGTKCIVPCMYNHIIFGPHSFTPSNPILHSVRSKLSNSGRMYRNECQSWALRGILFSRLLRNMDYEWGRDQTCCGFNMYESFHMHRAHSFICHSRWGSGSASDIGEKQPHGLGVFSAVLG